MKHNTLACQESLGRKYFKPLLGQFRKLDIPVSESPNAQYGKDSLFAVACGMSDHKTFAPTAVRRLINGRAGKTGIPSARTFRDRMGGVEPGRMQSWCDKTISYAAKEAKKLGMVRRGSTVAIDMTDIPYHGKGLKGGTKRSKPKSGTSTFVSYVVAHTADGAHNVPLASKRIADGDDTSKIMDRMLKKIDRTCAVPGLVLVDRGFFSAACINALGNRKFVMPAVKNSRVKKAILEHHNKERSAASRFTIRSQTEEASFNLLITKKDKWKKSDRVEDRYVAFATNLPCRTKEELMEEIPEKYRDRWIIETGFRVIKEKKGKTCSNKMHIREFLFHFALLVYALWRMARLDDARSGWLAGGKDFTMDVFTMWTVNIAKELIVWEKQHGNYLESCAAK